MSTIDEFLEREF